MEVIIRKAILTDLKNLAVLKQQVWISTYATEGLNAEYSGYVLSEYSLKNVRRAISDNQKLILIATIHDCVIGCAEILLSPQSPIKTVDPNIEISTLYVLEKFQGFGIGKKLLEQCINEIKQLEYKQVWLTVYHKNFKAIEFYTRQNFNNIGETDFILGKEKHKNFIMLKNID